MKKQYWIAVGVLALAIVCALAWWGYREVKKRELQQEVAARAQDSTTRLRDALGVLGAGAEARAVLDAHSTALKEHVETMQAFDASLRPDLVRAADAYVTDVQALLRRQLAAHAGRDAIQRDIGEINEHLRGASTRTTAWFGEALALSKRLDKSSFDYRLAAGGIEKSLDALEESGQKLRAVLPSAVTVEKDLLVKAKHRLHELSAQIEQQAKNARKLPG
jgi:hypothetical protein